jgi:hypothetical protein
VPLAPPPAAVPAAASGGPTGLEHMGWPAEEQDSYIRDHTAGWVTYLAACRTTSAASTQTSSRDGGRG